MLTPSLKGLYTNQKHINRIDVEINLPRALKCVRFLPIGKLRISQHNNGCRLIQLISSIVYSWVLSEVSEFSHNHNDKQIDSLVAWFLKCMLQIKNESHPTTHFLKLNLKSCVQMGWLEFHFLTMTNSH